MKKNIIYIALACLSLTCLTACSDDPMDACQKHVYGEGEAPYLRTDASARTDISANFRANHISPVTISLKDNAEFIQTRLGMTVDDMLAGVKDGTIKFLNINSTKSCWDLTEPTTQSDGLLGWQYNDGGVITTSNAIATIGIDESSKSIIVDMAKDAAAGTMFSVNLGFAKVNGKDYDKYVRFSIASQVSDPGMVTAAITIPTGDYSSYELDFNDCTNAIVNNFAMTVSEFNTAVQDSEGDIAMYMVDASGNWIKDASYTANGIGYWCAADGTPMGWGDGCAYFVETHDGTVGIGRYPDMASGTVYNVHFVYASKSDPSKFVEFKIVATLE